MRKQIKHEFIIHCKASTILFRKFKSKLVLKQRICLSYDWTLLSRNQVLDSVVQNIFDL